jgi:hypothetical protein
MGTCNDDAIVLSSGDGDFCKSDDSMSLDEDPIVGKLFNRCMKNMKI